MDQGALDIMVSVPIFWNLQRRCEAAGGTLAISEWCCLFPLISQIKLSLELEDTYWLEIFCINPSKQLGLYACVWYFIGLFGSAKEDGNNTFVLTNNIGSGAIRLLNADEENKSVYAFSDAIRSSNAGEVNKSAHADGDNAIKLSILKS